ncbi:MAG: hypothetical protein IJD91_01150 [Clostridia bacterium]|nr:hypothetical protein [Clostridia bacterium]
MDILQVALELTLKAIDKGLINIESYRPESNISNAETIAEYYNAILNKINDGLAE